MEMLDEEVLNTWQDPCSPLRLRNSHILSAPLPQNISTNYIFACYQPNYLMLFISFNFHFGYIMAVMVPGTEE